MKIRPKDGSIYYYLNAEGRIKQYPFNRIIDEMIWGMGNGFYTREEARQERERRQALQRKKDELL